MATPIRHGKKWRARWVDASGIRRSAVFASFDEARYQGRRLEIEAEEVRRGLIAPILGDKTFSELCDQWLAVRAPQKRSGEIDRCLIEKHLRPTLGAYRLVAINRDVLDAYAVSRKHLDPKTIHNHLTLVIAMLNFAKASRWLAEVPRIVKPRIALNRRDFRFLKTAEEIRRFLRVAREACESLYALYACAVFTGMREGELAGLDWSDVDFERRIITVQRSFDGPTKSDAVRRVPILDVLLPVLREWRLRCPGRIVFPNQAMNRHQPSARVFQERFHQILERAGFPAIQRARRQCRYLTFHDLRHTFASHWMMNGGSLFKLREVLGHSSVQMTQRYAHLCPQAYEGDYSRFSGMAPSPGQADVFSLLSDSSVPSDSSVRAQEKTADSDSVGIA